MFRTSIVLTCGSPATEKIAHAAHHAAGMINLRYHRRYVVVGPREIAAGRAHDLLYGSRQRADGRHRLVDLVRERGRQAAHQVEACGLGCRGFLLLEPSLGFADEALGIVSFADNHSDNQSGGSEDEHERLQFGEGLRVIAVKLHEPH